MELDREMMAEEEARWEEMAHLQDMGLNPNPVSRGEFFEMSTEEQQRAVHVISMMAME